MLNRKHFETSGYLKNMPQLAGTIHSFEGDQKAHQALIQELDEGKDYAHRQKMTDVVLTPAGCYPLYPTLQGRPACRRQADGRVLLLFPPRALGGPGAHADVPHA